MPIREISASERKLLEGMLSACPSTLKRCKDFLVTLTITWAALLMAVIVLWVILAWVIKLILNINYGWNSPAVTWIFLVGIPFCGSYAIYSSIKWFKNQKDIRPLLRDDLTNGKVIEENLHIEEIKRFQEPEHGGLIYFLKTDDNRVYVLFDEESQDLGVNDEDPLSSSFQVRNQFKLIDAPLSNLTIQREFSGSPLNPGEPFAMLTPVELWPENETWCSVSWDKLESHFENHAGNQNPAIYERSKTSKG